MTNPTTRVIETAPPKTRISRSVLGFDGGDDGYCHRLVAPDRTLCGIQFKLPVRASQTHTGGLGRCGKPPCPECRRLEKVGP